MTICKFYIYTIIIKKLSINFSILYLYFQGKSDIWLNSVRFQSDIGHFRPTNLTDLKNFLSQTWPESCCRLCIPSISPQPKHTTRQMYLTQSTASQVTAQRILHPLIQGPTKLMSKENITDPKHVRVIYRLPAVLFSCLVTQ